MRGVVAFDLDGVLYTSEPFLGETYREAIAAVNALRPASFPRVPTTREILDHVGWPLSTILGRLFPDVDPVAVRLLYDESLRVICRQVEEGLGLLFPEVRPTLRCLAARGLHLTIASNGRRAYIEAVLSTYDLRGFFAPLLTVDGGDVADKAGLLRCYLRQYAIGPEAMVMVGDRSSDVEAARSVGCAFVGCDYGHGYRDEIGGAGPIITGFGELPDVIATLL
ncbi:MAG: HAD family hydrolase [Deltaproteobacteria bacterium]|nr:HAD family hydrolase [Deltaproteobacteria bacterium]